MPLAARAVDWSSRGPSICRATAQEPDIVEVGLPHSDPLMDGPVIAEAVHRALTGGTKISDVLRTVEAVAAAGHYRHQGRGQRPRPRPGRKDRQHTDLPVAMGLGVSSAAQAAQVATFADGVIVGSAFVRRLLEAADRRPGDNRGQRPGGRAFGRSPPRRTVAALAIVVYT